MKLFKYILFFISFLLVFMFHSQQVLGQADIDKLETIYEAAEYISDGDTLRYRIMVPEEFEEDKTYPLVLFLHGAGERGNDNRAQLTWGTDAFADPEFRQEHPAIVIAPQVPEGDVWANLDRSRERPGMMENPSTPLKLARELVQKMTNEYPVNENRLYITGLSMGGFGTWDMITRHPDLFAAAMPICGGGDPTKAHLLTDIPIWNFHGAQDEVVPARLSREMIHAIQISGGSPGYTEYPDVDHFSWVPAYNDRYALDWLFAQEKGSASE